MALRFADSFDHYSTVQLLNKWTSATTSGGGPTISTTAGRRGGGALLLPPGTVTKVLDPQTTWTVGMACYFTSLGASVQSLITLFSGSGNTQIDLALDGSSGVLSVRRGGVTTLGSTAAGQVALNAWVYIEFKVFVNGSTGTYNVQVNGVSALSGTGANTAGYVTTISADRVQIGSASHVYYIDDFYVCDDTGSLNTSFLGDVRVQMLYPSGAGAHTQWTPNTGTNYGAVNEHPANDDTTYIASSTANQIDTYALDDLPAGTVKAVQTVLRARKDDAGTRIIAPVFRVSSTDYVGTNVSVGDSYQWYTVIQETNPATSAAWTVTEINAAELGVKLIS